MNSYTIDSDTMTADGSLRVVFLRGYYGSYVVRAYSDGRVEVRNVTCSGRRGIGRLVRGSEAREVASVATCLRAQ